MTQGWTDAEFEVVAGPVRRGDAHPTRRRWVYAGQDQLGRALWYRRPRLNRWQYLLALLAAVACAWVLLVICAWGFHRLPPY